MGYPTAPDVLPGVYPPAEVDGADAGAPVSIAGMLDSKSPVAMRCSGPAAATVVSGVANDDAGLVDVAVVDVVAMEVDGVMLSGIVNPPEEPELASEVGIAKSAGGEIEAGWA